MRKNTPDELMIEIKYIRESTDKIEKHLERLNGKVETHGLSLATLDARQKVVWAVLGTLGIVITGVIMNMLFT